MILSDVLTCTVPPLRVESSLLKNPIPPKVEDGTSSLFARKHTARKLEGLPFRAAIGDRQAVYWWLLGHELSFQAKSLGSRPRASNRHWLGTQREEAINRFEDRGL